MKEDLWIMKDAFKFLTLIFIYIGITRIFMEIANLIGEKLGIGKFIVYLWEKIGGIK